MVTDTIKAEELAALVPTIKISDKATITPASGVAQDFSKPHLYRHFGRWNCNNDLYGCCCW